MPAPEAPFLRFHRLFDVDAETNCWVWKSITGSSGYGCFKEFGKMVSAHRFAYRLYKGEIPEGLIVLHSCDNRLCVNPEHLRAGTHSENMCEAWERGDRRRAAPKPEVPANYKPVLVMGMPFKSIVEAERALGLRVHKVRHWLKKKSPNARLISTEEYLEMIAA